MRLRPTVGQSVTPLWLATVPYGQCSLPSRVEGIVGYRLQNKILSDIGRICFSDVVLERR
jgi:hypothetical protein